MGQRIDVASEKPYPVFLGAQLEELGEFLRSIIKSTGHLLIITHPTVERYYATRLKSGLEGFRVDILTVPEGEEEKCLDRLSSLTAAAVACGADRETVVLALGGGVIGDLAGFFASIFMRGIRLVQIPTTFLAYVDSSIGGKVAVNHPAGKNLLGSFYPPLAVWMDFSALQTLPWDEVQNGLAETVKHAVIADEKLFEDLESHTTRIIGRDPVVYQELAARSAAIKVKHVSEDEREVGCRMLLNFGHSFGHALETEMSYRGIAHGQAVSLGMVAAAYLAGERGYITGAQTERLVKLLQAFGLPVALKEKDPLKLLKLMEADKKNSNKQKVLILPKGLGKAVVARDVRDEEILKAWEKLLR